MDFWLAEELLEVDSRGRRPTGALVWSDGREDNGCWKVNVKLCLCLGSAQSDVPPTYKPLTPKISRTDSSSPGA